MGPLVGCFRLRTYKGAYAFRWIKSSPRPTQPRQPHVQPAAIVLDRDQLTHGPAGDVVPRAPGLGDELEKQEVGVIHGDTHPMGKS